MSSNEPVDYRIVLADLEAKKVALERMIESVKQFIGIPMPHAARCEHMRPMHHNCARKPREAKVPHR